MSKEARRNDSGVVQNEQVVGPEEVGKIAELSVAEPA